MNIITATAFSNFKKNRSRNILIGIAIALTAFLLTILPTVVMGQMSLQFAAANEIYAPFHGAYLNVDEETAGKLKEEEDFEVIGFREDPGQIYCEGEDVTIGVMAADDIVLELSKIKLKEGRFPEKADEIVVSEGLLKALGISGDIGDGITVPFQQASGERLLKAVDKEFIITGMTEDTKDAVEQGRYEAYVSEAFAREAIPEGSHSYQAYFRLKDTEGMVTETIEDNMYIIGEKYGISEADISENSAYLTANYVDGALYGGMAVLLLVIVLTGVLTIYSIYYVSMLDKVQEYGRLRAIGATKWQIKKLVLREGLAVAAFAVPLGIILGLLGGILLQKFLVNSSLNTDDMLAEQIRIIMNSGEVRLIKGWIILVAAAVSFLAVYISLLLPMRKASKISAIEAIRYQGDDKVKKQKKERRGYTELNIGKLAMVNLGRNKKRTIITIATLGATGILFVVVASLCACISADNMARQNIRKDIKISLDAEAGNEMHPEQELSALQKSNPMTEELQRKLEAVDGVEAIETVLQTGLSVIDENGEVEGDITGISDSMLKEMKKYVTEGSLDDPSLKEGKGVIFFKATLERELPGYVAGDKLSMKIADGGETRECEMEIAAIVDAPVSLIGYYCAVPKEVLTELCSADLTYTWNIAVEKGKENAAAEEIEKLISDAGYLEMSTYSEYYEEAETSIRFMLYGGYGILFIFGLIGILNLVNTMINSVHVRKKELGMLSAIGMSGRQTVYMLQLEGLFYTAGTLALSLGAGSLLGYGAFLWARDNHFMSVTTYRYPTLPALMLGVIVLAVQILITYFVNMNFKKLSLIDRIRFAD